MAGHLITVEGIGGSGKTTLVKSISHWLDGTQVTHVVTREPGGTVAGGIIRGILLDPSYELSPWTEALLFEADRAETYAKMIKPALATELVVISDRNFYGTIAYQGFGRRLDLEEIGRITDTVMDGISPDLILVLDLDPEAARGRMRQTNSEDRFDRQDLAFQRRVRNGYLFAAKQDSDNAVVLDASQEASSVASQAIALIASLLAGERTK